MPPPPGMQVQPLALSHAQEAHLLCPSWRPEAAQAGVPRLVLIAMRVSTDASSWDAGAASHTLQSLDMEGLVGFWPTLAALFQDT